MWDVVGANLEVPGELGGEERAGESMRILDVTDQPDVGLPQEDFWLSEDVSVVPMEYDEHGVQLGRGLLEDIDPAPYVAWKRLTVAHAQPFTQYTKHDEIPP